jgi:WD40 repeat protein
VTTSADDTARVWDAVTGKPGTPFIKHRNPVHHACFSPDGRRIVTGSGPMGLPGRDAGADDGEAQVWDAATGKPVTPPLRHRGAVVRVAFSLDGRRVATASRDKTARVWDAATGRPVTPPIRQKGRVEQVAFSPDGRRVLSASQWTAQVWDAATGKPAGRPMQHKLDVLQAEFSPDGRRVVTACYDHTARVWDAVTGKPLTPPMRHSREVDDAAFSPDGRLVVTASHTRRMKGEGGEARVWDAATGEPVTPPLKHDGPVYQASFSPDGRRILTASDDRTARIWELPSDDRSPEVLRQLAQVLSGHRIDTTGSLAPLEMGVFRQLWERLRPRYPADFAAKSGP